MATQRRAGGGKATEGALVGSPVGGLLRGRVMGKTAEETAGAGASRGMVPVGGRRRKAALAGPAGSGRRGVSAASGRRLDAGYREEVSDVDGERAGDAGIPAGAGGTTTGRADDAGAPEDADEATTGRRRSAGVGGGQAGPDVAGEGGLRGESGCGGVW